MMIYGLLKKVFGQMHTQLHQSPSQEGSLFKHPDSSQQLLVDDTPPHLISLATAYMQVPPPRDTREGQDARRCLAYLKHIEDPTNHPLPFLGSEGGDLCDLLQRRNVQAVAVQEIAKTLGWWEGEAAPFVLRPRRDYMREREIMVQAGMRVDLVPEELSWQERFKGYVTSQDISRAIGY